MRQTIVPAATFDLRAAINTRCLTPLLLILHFPPLQLVLAGLPDGVIQTLLSGT